jgi:hypothetical protein
MSKRKKPARYRYLQLRPTDEELAAIAAAAKSKGGPRSSMNTWALGVLLEAAK